MWYGETSKNIFITTSFFYFQTWNKKEKVQRDRLRGW
jgi:hypothetical protein